MDNIYIAVSYNNGEQTIPLHKKKNYFLNRRAPGIFQKLIFVTKRLYTKALFLSIAFIIGNAFNLIDFLQKGSAFFLNVL